jgi:hypothetical protein
MGANVYLKKKIGSILWLCVAMGSLSLLISIAYPVRTWCQNKTGAISGIVVDPSGSVVPGVTVSVTDLETNVTTKTESNSAGNYVASFLNPGSYQIAFSKQGFQTHVTKDISLSPNQNVRIDAKLLIGTTTQTVTVLAVAPQLNRTTPDITSGFHTNEMINLPLSVGGNGRVPDWLAALSPGVSSTSSGYTNINNFSFGGGRPTTNQLIVNGIPTTIPTNNTYEYTPNPDSLQEMQALVSPFSAQYGYTGGGALVMTTKSGTNLYHGSLYWYYNDQALNARSYFASPGSHVQRNLYNSPGGTIGGPVIIPHLYDGRNKTFFFFDANVTFHAQGVNDRFIVPTPQELQGDFSSTMVGGQPVTIYDPNTTQVVNGQVVRQPFPGNIIPTSRIDSVAANIAKYYPEPNPASCSSSDYNYCIDPTERHTYPDWEVRIDQNFGDKDRAFLQYAQDGPTGSEVPIIPNAANTSQRGGWRDYLATLSETHIFSPTVANQFRAGVAWEWNFDDLPPGVANVNLGLQGVPASNFPDISMGNGIIEIGGVNKDSSLDATTTIADTVTVQKGRHTLNFGGDYRWMTSNLFNPGLLSGQYSFGPTFTGIPGQANTGYSAADFLLGLPTQTGISTTNYTFRNRIRGASAFIQDDYKVTPKLTVNLGLRWEYDGPWYEVNNQMTSFDPGKVNAATGKPGDVLFAWQSGTPDRFMPSIYHDVLPRIGFAWNFMPMTVLRGGYGIYRFPSSGFTDWGRISQFTVDTSFTSPDGITPAYQLDQGVPSYNFQVPLPASLSNPTSNVTALDSRVRTPYNQNWQLGIQHAFSHNWTVELDYTGQHGVKLPVEIPFNQLQPSLWQLSESSQNGQSMRPYPQYLNVECLCMDGSSNYNALLAHVTHRWSNGFSLTAAYTWAKAMTNIKTPSPERGNGAAIQNIYNVQAEYAVAGYDIPQRFVAGYVYGLPFGKGGKYFTSAPGVSYVVGGWQVSGMTTFQKGYPYNVSQPNFTFGYTQTQYPDRVASPYVSNPTLNQWFNGNAFQVSPVAALGSSSRNPFFGPGQNDWDLSLMRNFHIMERLNFQTRVDFTNAFNHPQWNGLGTNITANNYGVVTSALPMRQVQFAGRLTF